MKNEEKYTDIIVLIILAITVINWYAVFSVANIITAVSFLLGTIYIVASLNKNFVHYKLVFSIAMAMEVIPAFLLKGEMLYTISAIVLVVLIVFKQVKYNKDLKNN